jgi:hypothetical protein
MSKMKTPKQKRMNPNRHSVIRALNIPLPDELCIPIMLDRTGLHAINAIKDEVNNLNAQVVQLRNAAESRQRLEVVPPSVVKAFATIATNAWRAKIKMVDSDSGEAKEEMKRVYRHIEAIFESLKQIGVETIDPFGLVYDSGMALKVVSFEPTPGLSSEEIKETIKPSVAWQGHLIQMGEVIVGTPQKI